MNGRHVAVLIAIALGFTPISGAGGLPAFPGAEGFGHDTPGGRGGRVIAVTNLYDDGPGSLRHAMSVETGPRIVVFRIGGTIKLQRPIIVRAPNSFLTVAGQTAPGDGIQLIHYGIRIQDGAHDIVLRYLRLRPGTADPGQIGGDSIDGLTLWGRNGSHVHRVVIDHVSMTWAVDENANHWKWVTDVTYQWCIFAEGSTRGHPEANHSMGLLVGGDPRSTVSIHHSLFAHNLDRNPSLQGARADVRNNLIYNWGSGGSTSFADGLQVNLVNNHYLPGPESPQTVVYVAQGARIHLAGNWSPLCPAGCADETRIGLSEFNWREHLRGIPVAAPTVTTHPTGQVKELVLSRAGANRPRRDAVDARIIREVRAGTGQIGIGSGYPQLRTGTAPADRDQDGMPDAWEHAQGLDPNDAQDRNTDADGNGYTAIEDYLHALTQRQ